MSLVACRMMTTYSKHVADWEGDAYGPFVSVPQVHGLPTHDVFLHAAPPVSVASHQLLDLLLRIKLLCAATPSYSCGCGFMVRRFCLPGSFASHTVLHDDAGLPARQRIWPREARQQRDAEADVLCAPSHVRYCNGSQDVEANRRLVAAGPSKRDQASMLRGIDLAVRQGPEPGLLHVAVRERCDACVHTPARLQVRAMVAAGAEMVTLLNSGPSLEFRPADGGSLDVFLRTVQKAGIKRNVTQVPLSLLVVSAGPSNQDVCGISSQLP